MKKLLLLTSLALSAGIILNGCKKDDIKIADVKDTYDGSTYASNTTREASLRKNYDDLGTELRRGRTDSLVLDINTLNALFSKDASLKNLSVAELVSRIEGTYFPEIVKASQAGTYTPGTPSGDGGVLGGFLFDENGVDLEEQIKKSIFGATFYYQAVQLLANPDQAKLDQAISLLGAHADFKNSDNTAKHGASADKNIAAYIARRDKNDGNGLYTRIAGGFRTMQAAIKVEDKELAAAGALTIRVNWEKGSAATAINYLHSVIAKLSATSPSDADKGSALHAYGEVLGFIQGFRLVPQEHRLATNQQLEEVLELLRAPWNGTPSPYMFVTNAATELNRVTQAIDKLKTIYGFSDQDIQDFKQNWVSAQGR